MISQIQRNFTPFDPSLIKNLIPENRLKDKIRELQTQIENQNWSGTMYSSSYDTAWVASLRSNNDKPYFPRALTWLLNHQHPDGSWGSYIPSLSDRIISTASAVRTLLEYDLTKAKSHLQAGFDFLHANLKTVDL